MQKVFIAGCGYIGERLARFYQNNNTDVICMVRSEEHAERLKLGGLFTLIAKMDDIETIPKPDINERILFYLIPPPGGGVSDSRARNFLASIYSANKPSKIIYMSATSVYDGSQNVVTEDTPVNPDSAMGKRRLDAEKAFTEYGKISNVPVIILRVSGIYGKGRLPIMQIDQGQPLLNEDEAGPSNRIHADDLASVCIAVAEACTGGDLFNVSDGNPSSMTSYFNACADALKLPRQPQISLKEAMQIMSPLMYSYATQSRIVDNSKMLKQLELKLRYPDLIDGLAASVK